MRRGLSLPTAGTPAASSRGAVLWGARGQAKVLRPALAALGLGIACLYDRDPATPPPFADVPLLHDLVALERFVAGARAFIAGFAVAIGGDRGHGRIEIAARLEGWGLAPLTLVHPRAWVADSACLAPGCQVLALAAISEEARLGRQCIVNTSASVDHECVLGNGVHVMPGATLAGLVTVGDFATIGSGATVLPRLRIGAGAFVGAGAVVTRDVPDGAVVVGIPARIRPNIPNAVAVGGRP